MTKATPTHRAHAAMLTIAEIKAAAEAFDRGDSNLYDALDSIIAAVEAYRSASRPEPRRDAA